MGSKLQTLNFTIAILLQIVQIQKKKKECLLLCEKVENHFYSKTFQSELFLDIFSIFM